MISSIIVVACATAVVWVVLWRHSRARQRRRLRAMQSCDCSESFARAQRMDDSVKRTLAELDSRDPDKDEPSPPMTPRMGASTVTIPGIMVLLAGMFIAGGAVRERVDDKAGFGRADAGKPHENKGLLRSTTSIDSRLAELRTRPTLATVSYFRARPASPETIAAMQLAATSTDPIVSQAAQVALAHWGKPCTSS